MASSWVACAPVTSRCKEGTLYVSVTLTGAAEGADQLVIDVALDAGTPRRTTLPNTAGLTQGGVQVEFPGGYPKGHAITITIEARQGGVTLATASGTSQLAGACESLAITVAGAPLPDLRVAADLTGGPDLLPPPPDGADLAVDPDLADPADLATSMDDLTIPFGSDLAPGPADLTPSVDLSPIPAVLQFQVGSASPTPPNPASYGTTNGTTALVFTLKNVGLGTSSPINTFLLGATNIYALAADNCDGQSLGPSQACTLEVDFLAGQPNQMAGTWNASVNASATNGGTTTNNLSGTAAYVWEQYTNYGTHYGAGPGSSYTTTEPSGSCTTKGGTIEVKYFDAPAGLQIAFVRSAGCDASCGLTSNWCFVSAPSQGLRECFGETGQDYVFESGGRTGTFGAQQTCFPSGTASPAYTNVVNTPQAPGVATVDGCDAGYNAMTRIFMCR